MQDQSKDCMEIEHQKFCHFSLFSFKFQNVGELRVELHKPSLKRKKQLQGIRNGLVEPNVLWSQFVLSFLHAGSFDVCATCWWEISNKSICYA